MPAVGGAHHVGIVDGPAMEAVRISVERCSSMLSIAAAVDVIDIVDVVAANERKRCLR